MSDKNVVRLPQKLQITQPAPLSLDCIRKPLIAGKGSLICWCPDTHFGGLYFIETAMWHTMGPFDDLDGFKRFLGNSFPEAMAQKH